MNQEQPQNALAYLGSPHCEQMLSAMGLDL